MTTCNNCGENYSGNYCPNCGTPSRPRQQSISNTFWNGSNLEETFGFVSTLLRIASSPIRNTLSFASSVAFNQKAFLVKCIAISAAIGFLSKVKTTSNITGSIVSAGGMYILVFIQVVLTYYGFRIFSTTLRSGGDYARLLCIAQGVAFLLMGAGEFLGLALGPEIYTLALIGQAIILIPFWAMVLGRFWNMNPVLAYVIYIVSMLPAAGVLFLAWPIIESFIYF